MSFAQLKRNRSNSISKLVEAARGQDAPSEKKSYADERLWKPQVDKAGNGYAVIRFLPTAEGNELPWVRYWDHGFKGPTGQWYIERSLTSIGQQDPVSELNTKLWNESQDDNSPGRRQARDQKRRLHYVSNILVESDPANPSNEGQVFLFQYGKKIYDKIMEAMQPQFEDESPVDPFDFWEGASFKLKIRNVEGYRNYDKSEFSSSTALSESDDELEEIYDRLYDLSEFTDPKSYKTYDELSARLAMVLGEKAPKTVRETVAVEEQTSSPFIEESTPVSDDDEDTMSYFAKLAEED
jgi:hypothetical protein